MKIFKLRNRANNLIIYYLTIYTEPIFFVKLRILHIKFYLKLINIFLTEIDKSKGLSGP